jgi:hypothetical protein
MSPAQPPDTKPDDDAGTSGEIDDPAIAFSDDVFDVMVRPVQAERRFVRAMTGAAGERAMERLLAQAYGSARRTRTRPERTTTSLRMRGPTRSPDFRSPLLRHSVFEFAAAGWLTRAGVPPPVPGLRERNLGHEPFRQRAGLVGSPSRRRSARGEPLVVMGGAVVRSDQGLGSSGVDGRGDALDHLRWYPPGVEALVQQHRRARQDSRRRRIRATEDGQVPTEPSPHDRLGVRRNRTLRSSPSSNSIMQPTTDRQRGRGDWTPCRDGEA